jgi:hypothetical protein
MITTTAVNDRIRRRKLSFTIVCNVKYDRISSYYLIPDLRPYIVVSYTIVCDRILSFTPSYSVVFIKKLQIETKTLPI